MDEAARIAKEAQILLSPEWQVFENHINRLPRDFEAFKTPVPPYHLSLFDLLSGLTPKEPEENTIRPQYKLHKGEFNRITNAGDGNCLYHALEGRDLDTEEIRQLRAKVSEINLHNTNEAANALYVAATLMQTPATQSRAARLTSGRCAIPSQILADLQKVPGIHAGEKEIQQWSILKNKRVFIYYQSEKYIRITPAGREQVFPAALNVLHEFSLAHVTLYYQSGHWRKVSGIHLDLNHGA